ncbi:MAG TPA: SPOR domain-containing protein [Bacteroidota bacterium]|nr:SPOR domain-containing protein [Bacteroidota bacterium]
MRTAALLLGASALLALRCGTSSESDRAWTFSTPDSTTESKPPAFEAHADTVAVKPSQDQAATAQRTSAARYSVQIGSFRFRRNAGRAHTLARQRFQLPVINDYDAARKLYQIRVGFFSTWDEALAFRNQLLATHPQEYGDAWIVRIPSK